METDSEKHGLRAAVKNVLVEVAGFEWQDGELTEKPSSTETLTFNQNGWLTEQTTHISFSTVSNWDAEFGLSSRRR